MDKTVQFVQKEGSLEAKLMLEGHPATAPVMALVLTELRAGSFVEVSPDTEDWLRRLWSGLLNSKLVEDANKIQREAEQRHGTSKTIGRLEGWNGLSRKKLLASSGGQKSVRVPWPSFPRSSSRTSGFPGPSELVWPTPWPRRRLRPRLSRS